MENLPYDDSVKNEAGHTAHADASVQATSSRPVLIGLVVVVALYGLAAVMGYPQAGRDAIVAAASHGHEAEHANSSGSADHAEADHADHHDSVATPAPPVWTVIPFLALLGAIAAFPLIPTIEHWWEHNSSRFMVAAGLGLLTLLYYALLHPHAVEVHFPAHDIRMPADGGISWGVAGTILSNAFPETCGSFRRKVFCQ